MFGLFKKKQPIIPQVQYRYKIDEEKIYELRVVMKTKDIEYRFLFNNFEVCSKIKDNIVSEITRGAKVINYIHEGKNAIDVNSLRRGGADQFAYPKADGYYIFYPYAIAPATNLQAITFSVDDISVVRMKDKIEEVTKKVMHVKMTQDEFDKKVEDWHTSKIEKDNPALYEYLGLTESEYTDIVENFIPKVWGSVPEKIVKPRWD